MKAWANLAWGLLLLSLGAGAEIRVADDAGREVVLQKPAMRIVSLAPHATELLFAAGAGEKIVGAVSYSDYPPAAEAIPRVGGYKSVDLERVLALQPDLVIAWHSGNGEPLIERLRALGLTVFASEPRRIGDIARSLERLGELAGSQRAADSAADKFRARHEALKQRYSERPPVSVFYQIWNRPLMTVNGEHLISQVIELCGGRNVFEKLPVLTPTVDVEAVLAASPEVIVASGMGEERPEWLGEWRRWGSLPAVKRDNLYFVPPSLIQRHSPRILEGAERLCLDLEQAREQK